GRFDHQVKLRGYRIELGEIEAALAAIDGVAASVVIARNDAAGHKRLFAYVVPAADAALTPTALHDALEAMLPAYMIPNGFVSLEALPVTANGKVDRRALLELGAFDELREEFVAPRDALERKLADLFCEVLETDVVGVHDNFFALGGHSLLAVRLVDAVEAALGVELPLRALFEGPTVEQLARRLALGAGTEVADGEG
ncbi:MAG: lgrD, partial [Myxococcales bacterium]|nr:lgrD [Myxococcales bacterium]